MAIEEPASWCSYSGTSVASRSRMIYRGGTLRWASRKQSTNSPSTAAASWPMRRCGWPRRQVRAPDGSASTCRPGARSRCAGSRACRLGWRASGRWSTTSSCPSAMPKTRWPTRVAMSCSTRSGMRATRGQAVKRPSKLMARPVVPSSSTPAFEVVALASKAVTTRRPSTVANSNSSGLTSVSVGDISCISRRLRCRRTFAESGPRCTYHPR